MYDILVAVYILVLLATNAAAWGLVYRERQRLAAVVCDLQSEECWADHYFHKWQAACVQLRALDPERLEIEARLDKVTR